MTPVHRPLSGFFLRVQLDEAMPILLAGCARSRMDPFASACCLKELNSCGGKGGNSRTAATEDDRQHPPEMQCASNAEKGDFWFSRPIHSRSLCTRVSGHEKLFYASGRPDKSRLELVESQGLPERSGRPWHEGSLSRGGADFKKTWRSKLCSESRVAVGLPMLTGSPSWRNGNSAPRIRSVASLIGSVFIFPVDSVATHKM
jgi:hypothetical protein